MQHVPVPALYPGRTLLAQLSERGYIDTGCDHDGRVYLAEIEVDEIVRLALVHFPGLVEKRVGAVEVFDALTQAQARVAELEAELAVALENRVVPLAEVLAMQTTGSDDASPARRKRIGGRAA